MRSSQQTVFAALTAVSWMVVGVCACAQAPLPHRLVKMEYEATLTEVEDPLNIFPEVRVGDPVHGTIAFDPLSEILFFFLEHPWSLTVASMVVENPRGGPETHFLPDPDEFFNIGSMLNDLEDDEFEQTDGVLFSRSVAAPPGFSGTAAGITVGFLAPGDKYEELEPTLPDQIVLDEWPVAIVSFFDLADEDESGTTLSAEIHTLRDVPIGPGDFDANGVVDEGDLEFWQEEFSAVNNGEPFAYRPYADSDLDGDADGDDFLIWQQNLGGGVNSSIGIPEPSAWALAGTALATGAVRRRRARLIPELNWSV